MNRLKMDTQEEGKNSAKRRGKGTVNWQWWNCRGVQENFDKNFVTEIISIVAEKESVSVKLRGHKVGK